MPDVILHISSNIDATTELFEKVQSAMPDVCKAVTAAVADDVFEKDKKNLQEIYDQGDTETLVPGFGYLGRYTGEKRGRYYRSGALKVAESLALSTDGSALISTQGGTIEGPFGGKTPEDYAEERDQWGRPAGHFWRERAAEDGALAAPGIADQTVRDTLPPEVFA